MQKKEKVQKIVKEPEVKEEISVFQNGLLYGGYAVISNKTVRANEKLLIRWKNHNSKIPGKEMIKTNRGYFIDGYNVDQKSTDLWFNLTGLDKNNYPKKNETRKNHRKQNHR